MDLHQLKTLSQRHGFSADAVAVVSRSLEATGGRMAQFDHPELAGFGQWMPEMIMIGDMANLGLKARIDALC